MVEDVFANVINTADSGVYSSSETSAAAGNRVNKSFDTAGGNRVNNSFDTATENSVDLTSTNNLQISMVSDIKENVTKMFVETSVWAD